MSETLVITFPPKNEKPISPEFLVRTARLFAVDPHLGTTNPVVERESIPPTITVTIQRAEARGRIEQLLNAQGVLFQLSSPH